MLIGLVPAKVRADERRSTLLLSVAAPAEESARLEAVTRELLQPLDVQLEVRRVPRVDLMELRRASAVAYFARVWIALSAAGSARLYLEHGESDRLLVRDVPGDPNNPELVREELGHILQAAVEGLKAGEEVGEPRQAALEQVEPEAPTAAPPQAPKAPPPPPERRQRWRAGLRYEARWLGDGARFEDGPGVVFGLVTRLGFELAGYYRRPFRVEQEPVGARLETASLRALLTFEPWPALRLGAGGGADVVRVAPLAAGGQSLEVTDAAWLQLAFGRLQATYGYRPWTHLELQVTVGADVDLSGTRYVYQRSTGELTLLDPFPLRPFLSLGAALP